MEELTWKQARKYVQKVEPKLAAIVDELSPDDSYKLYLVSYPYGSMIFEKAVLNLPNRSGEFVSFSHHTIPAAIREQLDYRVIPMGLVLDKAIEVHAELDHRMIPLTLISKGRLFGAWEAFDPPYSYFVRLAWNISSGARTTFMLPKITDKDGYQRLEKDFDIRHITMAKELPEHWKVFKALANSAKFPVKWESKILFFGKKWFEQVNAKRSWLELTNYLYGVAWQQSVFWRFHVTLNLVWQQFAMFLKLNHIKCGSYPLETLKHLITLGVGALPSLTAHDPHETMCPIQSLQKAFLESYEINYTPTIMVPHDFNHETKGVYHYYSMNMPTLIESVPKTREVSNVMQITREIKRLLEYFRDAAWQGVLHIENTPTYKMLEVTDFNFFHSGIDLQGELQLINSVPKLDKDLLLVPPGYVQKDFCYKSKFLSGFVRISSG
jgi:hypothetical protein